MFHCKHFYKGIVWNIAYPIGHPYIEFLIILNNYFSSMHFYKVDEDSFRRDLFRSKFNRLFFFLFLNKPLWVKYSISFIFSARFYLTLGNRIKTYPKKSNNPCNT